MLLEDDITISRAAWHAMQTRLKALEARDLYLRRYEFLRNGLNAMVNGDVECTPEYAEWLLTEVLNRER